eukprot:COSAG02_NODE_5431_length_4334_cov_6.607084_1_plen_83_part_00
MKSEKIPRCVWCVFLGTAEFDACRARSLPYTREFETHTRVWKGVWNGCVEMCASEGKNSAVAGWGVDQRVFVAVALDKSNPY